MLGDIDVDPLSALARLWATIVTSVEGLPTRCSTSSSPAARAERRLARARGGALCVDARRFADVAVVLDQVETRRWRRVLLADLVDPHIPEIGASDEEAWLALCNASFDGAGLEPIAMVGDHGLPFDRLAVPAAPPSSVSGPRVSVIMSVYRPDEDTLHAVRSIIDQTWRDWELLVIDDASGAEYDDIFARIDALDERVTVVRATDNAGTYVRRNEAIQRATGEFVTMQDSDDWSHPRRLELQVRHARAPRRTGQPQLGAAGHERSAASRRAGASTCASPSRRCCSAGSSSWAASATSTRRASRPTRVPHSHRGGLRRRGAAPRHARPRSCSCASTPPRSAAATWPTAGLTRRASPTAAPTSAGAPPPPPRTCPSRSSAPHSAPTRITGENPDRGRVDTLVVADVRTGGPFDKNVGTLRTMLKGEHAAGRTTAILHAPGFLHSAQEKPWSGAYHAIIDDGLGLEVFALGETLQAGTVAIWGPDALLGVPERHGVTADEVVLVDRDGPIHREPGDRGDRAGHAGFAHVATGDHGRIARRLH